MRAVDEPLEKYFCGAGVDGARGKRGRFLRLISFAGDDEASGRIENNDIARRSGHAVENGTYHLRTVGRILDGKFRKSLARKAEDLGLPGEIARC